MRRWARRRGHGPDEPHPGPLPVADRDEQGIPCTIVPGPGAGRAVGASPTASGAQRPGWFAEGEYPLHDAFCQGFLVPLRESAETWNTDVTPDDTTVETMIDPLAVSIEVPGTTGSHTTLWVLCRHDGHRASSLRAWWGTTGVVDDGHGGPDEPVQLISDVGGRSAPDAAALAARWFEQQLMTDVYRRFPHRLLRTGGSAVPRR